MTFTAEEIAGDLESVARDFSNSASAELIAISFLLNEAATKLRHMDAKRPEPAENPLQAAEIERLRLSLPLICADVERLDMALDPDDWAGDERMTDITARILARLDAIGVRSAGQEGGAA